MRSCQGVVTLRFLLWLLGIGATLVIAAGCASRSVWWAPLPPVDGELSYQCNEVITGRACMLIT